MFARRFAAAVPLVAALGMAPAALAQTAGAETRMAATDVRVEPTLPPEAPGGGYLEVGEGLAAALASRPQVEPALLPPQPAVRAAAKPRVTRSRPTSGVNKDAPLSIIADTLDRSGTNINSTIPDR